MRRRRKKTRLASRYAYRSSRRGTRRHQKRDASSYPLWGSGKEKAIWIGQKIRLLRREGKPPKQAAAIAYSMARKKFGKGKRRTSRDTGRHGGRVSSHTYGGVRMCPCPGEHRAPPMITFDPERDPQKNAQIRARRRRYRDVYKSMSTKALRRELADEKHNASLRGVAGRPWDRQAVGAIRAELRRRGVRT